ncbi:MAG: XrtA/PEP-CTERM system amidotransferase [Alphaproteobacteria bacterium]
MCGITGLFDSRGRREIDRGLLARMNRSQSHRGPDGEGYHLAPGIGLGHRRLAIIDLAGGLQPMFNDDRSVAVVFNGEIYNYRELKSELANLGHRFHTSSDTEVIVRGWEEWGEACVNRFRGMFAFALWDERSATLFLARDRLGIKPLYYAVLPDGMVLFASELKAILLHPGFPRDIDPTAVEDYFAYGYVPDPKCIYRTAAKLAPAHTLTIRRGGPVPEPRAYWNIAFHQREAVSEDEAAEELISELRDSVRSHMISDVPLGAFLSGGVDSSSVVAMMAEVSETPVNTCSISFEQRDYDESRYAAQVAERYRTRHHVERVDPNAFDLVDRLASMYDEPFADSSAMPTYRVCGLARKRVTVALSGDGGDELFAGYRRYRWHRYEEMVRRRIPDVVRRPVFGLLGRLYPKIDWAPKPLRAKTTLQAIARSTAEGFFDSASVLSDGLRARVFHPAFRRALQGYNAVEVLAKHMREAPTDHYLSRVQYADIKTYLPGDILTKVDRASMAHSLEVRVPILDHRFAEWTAGLPADMKLRGREGKYIFKRALRPYLPHEVLYRPKMGFAVPLASWFRGPLKERLGAALTGPALAETGMFDMNFVATLMHEHAAGLRDHSASLWALLMFDSFLRQVHASVADAAPAPTGPVPA